jgi:CelD/BcsL family acetyltransferase involved in cellulose biosynthesis
VGATARPRWRELAGDDASVGLARTPEWMDCIRAAGRFADATLLFRTADGRPLVVPRVRRAGVLFDAPPPGWGLGADAGGVLGATGPDDVRAVIGALAARPGLRTRVMVGGEEAELWRRAAPTLADGARTAHVLDLDGGFARVWSERFTGKVRSNARKAERRGVTVESDGGGRLLPVFDRLYRGSVDRWARQGGQPLALSRWRAGRVDPPGKFVAVAGRLGENCAVWVAWRNGEPLAALLVLTRGEHVAYWRGAMDKDATRGTGANELLHSRAIEAACGRGARRYDFGLYQTESLRRFKATFGAREVPVCTYHFERLPLAAAEARCRAAARGIVLAAPRVLRVQR